tara:strand:- start:1108 stop:3630 length:2523 start_codon:yes stop_codon:yes gene_type:complete
MSKSFTYNLIVTQSKEAIDTLFFDTAVPSNGGLGKTRRDLLQSFEDLGDLADDILISPYNNSDFLSFETEMNGGGTSTFTTIKLVETARVLERFLIPTDGVTEIVLNKFKRRIAKLKDKVDNDFLKAAMAVRPDYYISYGVGDDISKWSGPYCVSLMDTVLSVDSDGIRTLELTFTPTQETIKLFSNKVILADTTSLSKSTFEGIAAIAEKLKYEKRILVPVAPETDGSLRKVLKPNKDGDTWNNAIRVLIREYLSGIRGSVKPENTLVLFNQNLDADEDGPIVVKAKPYSDIISTYQAKLREFGIGIFAPGAVVGTEAKVKDRAKEDIARKPIKDKIAELEFKLTQTSPNQARKDIKKQIELLKEDAEAISVYINDPNTLPNIPDPFTTKKEDLASTPENVLLRAAQKLFSNPDSTSNVGKASTAPPSVILEMAVDVPTDKAVGGKLEMLSPLYTFFRTLNGVSETRIQVTIFEESNVNTLNLLYKHDLITDPGKPVLVIGDEDVIKNLIYTSTGKLPESDGDSVFSYGDGVLEDRAFLKEKWTNYRKELKEVNPLVEGITSSFGEEIDLGPYEKEYRDSITADSLVFMHNLKNSNVTELTVDASPYRAELLNLTAELSYKLIDQAADKAELTSDYTVFQQFAKEYTKFEGSGTTITPDEIISNINESVTLLRMIKESGVGKLDTVDFFDILRWSLDSSSYTAGSLFTTGGGFKVRTNGNTTKSNADLLRRAIGHTYEVNIRTLPFFNIVNYLKRDCLLVGVPNKIIGSTFREEDLPPASMYSNRYGIYGYKHVITPDAAYSEFKLFQNNIAPVPSIKKAIGDVVDYKKLNEAQEAVNN